jgi:hypothetical protein
MLLQKELQLYEKVITLRIIPKTHMQRVSRADNDLNMSCSLQQMAIVKSFQERKTHISTLDSPEANLNSDQMILPNLGGLACKCDSHNQLNV